MTEKYGWWAINGKDFLDFMRRAHAGEDPELLYMEAYANSDVERVQGDEPDDGSPGSRP